MTNKIQTSQVKSPVQSTYNSLIIQYAVTLSKLLVRSTVGAERCLGENRTLQDGVAGEQLPVDLLCPLSHPISGEKPDASHMCARI
jgi:hypothetical protein